MPLNKETETNQSNNFQINQLDPQRELPQASSFLVKYFVFILEAKL